MEMQRTLDGKPADTYVGLSIARTGANPRLVEYYSQLARHLRRTDTRPIFPITETEGLPDNENTIVYCLDANYYKGSAKQSRTMIHQINNPTHSNNRVYDPKGISPAINCAEGGNRQPFTKVKRVPLKFLGRNQIHFDDGDYAFTVDSCNTGGIEITLTEEEYDKKNKFIRRLTPLECERLQGFPDNWTEGISDTQRYKCLGNAVTVNVIEFISKHIFKILEDT